MTVRPFIALIAAALLVAGCSKKTGEQPTRPQSASGWVGREKVGDAIALLNRGEAEKARNILQRVIERQPGDRVAAKLLRQIDTPPETLLGGASFAYVTRPSDTMSSLAQRYLRDPMMFYALARYNGIAAPGRLEPGRTLRIPGKATEPPRKAATRAPTPAPAPASTPAKEAPPAPPVVDSGRAAQLRAQGLEQLNRGAVDSAVTLLRQASRLNPSSALIRRDLDRALRIQRTVRGNGA